MNEKNNDLVSSGLATISMAADYLSLSRGMIYKLMETGRLKYVKIGRARRIPKSSILVLANDSLIGGWKLPQNP